MPKRIKILAASIACVAILAAGIAWHLIAAGEAQASAARASPSLEIRWHGGGIVLQGMVRDAATQQALAASAAARLGGESEQVIDWLDITPAAPPVADPAALARLILLGQEGWHLQRRPTEGWLAVQFPADERSLQGRALLQAAFGPGVAIRLVQLP
ncbi:hypothetical protein FHT32_004952 [Variovorax sp. SG517]|uniref:hypothetical protein n=1 Tax=Variovorax sp. SG517 TaxID=2587117 RepID=UPI00159E5A41|nr:hypothetical protein [Variovorax sp. SG517]NVM91288.1 hypothetical protein [Variovorax sp. SG517]